MAKSKLTCPFRPWVKLRKRLVFDGEGEHVLIICLPRGEVLQGEKFELFNFLGASWLFFKESRRKETLESQEAIFDMVEDCCDQTHFDVLGNKDCFLDDLEYCTGKNVLKNICFFPSLGLLKDIFYIFGLC